MKSRPFTAGVQLSVVVAWVWVFFVVSGLVWYLLYRLYGLTSGIVKSGFFLWIFGGFLTFKVTLDLIGQRIILRRLQTRALTQLAKSFLAALRELYENNCESGVVFVSLGLLLQQAESSPETLSVSMLFSGDVSDEEKTLAERALDLAIVMYTRPLLMGLRPDQVEFDHETLSEAEFEELWKECPE